MRPSSTIAPAECPEQQLVSLSERECTRCCPALLIHGKSVGSATTNPPRHNENDYLATNSGERDESLRKPSTPH